MVTNGMVEQVRVDCGAEFFLTLFIQEKMRQVYGSREIAPFVQTPSTLVWHNHYMYIHLIFVSV